MAIGPFIRGCFGEYEHHITELYRSYFVHLDELQPQLPLPTEVNSILEVGCGEGSIAERLSLWFPQSSFVGIDITPRIGRLYRGRRENVRFIQIGINDYRRENPELFDLVLMCDVLHHVPENHRRNFVEAVASAVKPGGLLVIKDWERKRNVAHLLAYLSDRVLTGDSVRCMSAQELASLCDSALPAFQYLRAFRLPPHPNNIGVVLQRCST